MGLIKDGRQNALSLITDRFSKAGMSSDKAYRDWGTFKYWFRGVEKFAPWINKVYLVTDDQIPNLVKHRS